MSREEALRLLGIVPPYTSTDLEAAFNNKKTSTEAKLNTAPTDLLKQTYQANLLELNEAFSLLQKTITLSPDFSDRPSTHRLPEPEKPKNNDTKKSSTGVISKSHSLLFFLFLFSFAGLVYYSQSYYKLNKKYNKIEPDYKDLKNYKDAFKTIDKLTVVNMTNNDIRLELVQVYYLKTANDTNIVWKTFEKPIPLEHNKNWSPQDTIKNMSKPISQIIFIYLIFSHNGRKNANCYYVSELTNDRIELTLDKE